MPATLLPCQPNKGPDPPLPYTASPFKLLWEDICLFFHYFRLLPGLILPIAPSKTGGLDEFYPSIRNIGCVVLHVVLIIFQLLFLISLPVCVIFMVPALWVGLYVALFLGLNEATCDLFLNEGTSVLVSRVPEIEAPEHKHERWIFINGVCVGQSWLQQSIDRLGYTFGRKITGVHNPTSGMVFDILQVFIQRNFCYSTQDVRDAYAIAKTDLLDPQYKKVVLIAHSQGGIEAGLIIDWLLDEIPQELLRKLEVYTFGNAANHFNNPYRVYPAPSSAPPSDPIPIFQTSPERDHKTVLHIEHYANSGDFVSAWGVLNFTSIPNRYMGQVFVRHGSGHQFNQHYMDAMFTLGPDLKVLDSNNFMDMHIELPGSARESSIHEAKAEQDDILIAATQRSPIDTTPQSTRIEKLKVKDVSRLWQYRNGRSPRDWDSRR